MASRLRLAAASVLIGCTLAACGGSGTSGGGAIRIAVLLPLTGDGAVSFREPLDWAVANVNRTGVAGKKLQLVYTDTGKQNVLSAARQVAADPSIAAVIGPSTSNETFTLANLFIAARKPLVTPSATSADIFRAYSRSGYVWRTVASDIAQTQELLLTAQREHAKSVALLTSTDLYGTTFFDWFGFYATELGLKVTAVVRWDQRGAPCDDSVRKALAGGPDVLVAVPSTTAATVCIARRARGVRVLFSDAGEDPAAVQGLGAAAGGLEGIAPAPAAGNGFAQAFRQRFGTAPTPYAAEAYDAVALLAYGLEESNGAGGQALRTGLERAVDGRGAKTGWTAAGIGAALAAIHAGRATDVTGATGPFAYTKPLYTDPASSTYAHWRVEHGAFATLSLAVASATPTASASASLRRAVKGQQSTPVGPRKGLWAVLVAASYGPADYRHQADVLAQYQLLRHNGVPDDHIVLIVAGDAASYDGGEVRYTVGGPNLDSNVKIDYRLDHVTAAGFLDILAGRSSAAYPTVVQSSSADDVYVYIAGHGGADGIYFGVDQAVPAPSLLRSYTVLRPGALAHTIATMAGAHRYRRLLVALEACQGGVMGEALDAPNAMLLSAASPVEDSLSANYDPANGIWLADEFSYAFWKSERSMPGESLDALDAELYLDVAGEHVSAYGPKFGDAAAVKLSEFLTP